MFARKDSTMAIRAQLSYPGVTQENYDSMIPQVEDKLRAAPGFIAHLASATADGFQVTEVWESREALDTWLRETIAPMMAGAGGSTPEVQVRPLHHVVVNGKN
jgi:heme-degrading monooxygenase HmoA